MNQRDVRASSLAGGRLAALHRGAEGLDRRQAVGGRFTADAGRDRLEDLQVVRPSSISSLTKSSSAGRLVLRLGNVAES